MPLAAGFPSFAMDENILRADNRACQTAKVSYGLGSKAPSLTATPGKQFTKIDCSGYVRWAVYRASGGKVKMPDGSWYQGQWCVRAGLKVSTVDACKLRDGRVRIAYWHNKSGVSHIALVLNGITIESCGGRGPCRRAWNPTAYRWMREATIYVLEMDEDGAGPE